MTVTECESVPLAPVTVTWNVPIDAKLHDKAELPEMVMLVGFTVHDVLLVDKPTTPENPFSPVTVILDCPAVFALAATLDGLALIEKSGAEVTLYVTNAECVRPPLVPVTVVR